MAGMMFMKKRSSYKKKNYKSYASKYSKKSVPVRQVVRRELARTVETKVSQYYQTALNVVSLSTANATDVNTEVLGPDATGIVIQQGVGQGNRVGNAITTKKLVIKGTVWANPYDATSNNVPLPVQVKIWFFYDKANPTEVPSVATNFFQNGNSAKGFANDLTDMWAPVNTDRYRVVATRTFKIGNESYTSNGTGFVGAQYYSNNDFKWNANFSVDLTKSYPKKVVFNDNSSVPTTHALFMMTQFVAANGAAVGAGQSLVRMVFMQDYHYSDA